MSKPDAIKTSKNKYLPILIINAVLVLAVIFRAFLCISVMDEVFNIGQALRSLQGNTFLVENWDYFQTGKRATFEATILNRLNRRVLTGQGLKNLTP